MGFVLWLNMGNVRINLLANRHGRWQIFITCANGAAKDTALCTERAVPIRAGVGNTNG